MLNRPRILSLLALVCMSAMLSSQTLAQTAPPCDQCSIVAAPGLPATAPPGPPLDQINTKADLWKGGTVLRGANIWQKIKADEDVSTWPDTELKCGEQDIKVMETTYTPLDFSELAAWKANYVNFSFPAPASQAPFSRDGKYHRLPCVLKRLRELVAFAREAKLFVVIGFRTGPGRSENHFDKGDSSPLINKLFKLKAPDVLHEEAIAAQDAWVDAWSYVAEEFRNEPAVVGYELMIEPGTDAENYGTEVDGSGHRKNGLPSDIRSAGRHLWFDFAKKMIAAIRDPNRGNDPLTPILIGGTNYGNVCSLLCVPTDDFQTAGPVVFTAHQYEPDRYTHQDNDDETKCVRGESPNSFNKCTQAIVSARINELYAFRQQHRDRQKQPVAVAITEYGIKHAVGNASQFLTFEMDLLERLSANHALWLWEVKKPAEPTFALRLGSKSFVKAIQTDWAKNRIWATPAILGRFKLPESAPKPTPAPDASAMP